MFKHILKLNTKKIPAFLTIYYLFFGLIGIFLFTLNTNELKTFTKKDFCYILIISAIMLGVSLCSWRAINLASNPSLPKALFSIQLVFLIILSYLLFDIKISKEEFIGIIFILCGSSIIAFKSNHK
jgi:uncharacterized membrane protein